MSDFESLSLENQEATEELVWTLNASRGEFTLVIVRCNYAQLRDRAIVALQKRVQNVVVWAMPSETTALLEGIRECVTDETAAVMVTGLEGARELDELLSSTNRIREEFRSGCPFPVVLWVTDAGSKRLRRSAPDFESWGTTTHLILSTAEIAAQIQLEAEKWFSRERYADLPGSAKFSSVETELVVSRFDLSNDPYIFSDELEARLEALLGESCKRQNKYELSASHFIRALELWGFVAQPERKAKLILEVVFSLYYVAYNRNRNHSDWQKVESYLNQYLNFCDLNCPDLPLRSMPELGKILKKLEYWKLLQSLSQQGLNSDDSRNHIAQCYGFLAEIDLVEGRWGEASNFAKRALENMNDYIQHDSQEAMTRFKHFRMRVDIAWYQLLLARSMKELDQPVEAIKILENATKNLLEFQPSELNREILIILRSLYISQGSSWKAFGAKQELSFVEQQMGIRVFVGAGRLRLKQLTNINLKSSDSSINEFSNEIRSFGRSNDVETLVKRIASTTSKLTVLYGDSGVGKSSLVEGELIPKLTQKAIGSRENVPVLIRQYNNWVETILEALGESTGGIEAVLEKLRSNEDRNLRTILIFDQFEEFIFVQNDRILRQKFYTFLGQAILISNVNIILSLRKDYLHCVLECKNEMDMIEGGDVLGRSVLHEIGDFSPDEARSIIYDLTEQSQFTLEPALLDRMVADLAEPLNVVRPIELQIVGAQLQELNIRTFVDYPLGGKAELVDGYLMDRIADCGEGNGELAELVGYLLTDERGRRPLKTRDELVRELGALNRSPLPEQLDLVLAMLVGSGLVMRLKELPDDRYQLVHDYLAGVIRDRQKPQFDRLAKELDQEKEKRQLAEQNLETVNETLIALQEETKRTEIKLEAATNQVSLRKKQGTGILVGSIAMLTIASVGSFRAFQIQQESQTGTRLERAGGAAIEEFKFQQTEGLLSAMRSVYLLITFEREGRSIEGYPAANPLLAIQTGLDDFRETVMKGHQGSVRSVSFIPDGKTQGSVLSVSFSPDGKTIATSGEDGTARIWNTSGKQLAQFKGDQGKVFLSVSFSTDGKTIATSGEDGTARIWNTSGKQLAQFKGHQGSVLSVSFSPDGKTIATSGEDGTVRIWDTSGKQLAQFKGDQGRVLSVSFSPDGKTVAASGEDGTARIWNTSGKQVAQFKGHKGSVLSVSFSPDGKTIATSGEDGTVRIWDTSGKQLAQFKGDQGRVLSVSFSPDGKTVAASGEDGTARIWNTSGKQVAQFKGHKGSVLSVSFSPDGKTIATSGEDGTVRIWDTSGKQLAQFKGDQRRVLSVSFSPDGKTVATSGSDGTARIWVTSGKQLAQFKGHQGSVLSVSFSPDGKTIATSGSDGTARIRDIAGKQLAQFKGYQGSVLSVSFSPDGETIVTSGDDGTARIWDTSGKQFAQLKAHQGSLWSVSFSPDGKTIATSGSDGTARIWDTSGKQLAELKDDQRTTRSVSFSPDGKTIATIGYSGTALIWDVSGEQLAQLKGHQGIVRSVSFSPDGKTIATSGEDGTARIWDTSGKQLAQFTGDQGSLWSVSFSPDGRTIATSGYNGTARIWDTSGKQLAQLKGHQGIVRSVSFSPDGKTIATSGEDGTARIWDTLGRQIAQYKGEGYVDPDWKTMAIINPSLADPNNQIVTIHPLLPRSPTALLDRACQKLKYYILQSPELKDDRKMCGFEN